ncbi:hypothetical protein THAOC_17212, partial [Thalassiosira oceanica]
MPQLRYRGYVFMLCYVMLSLLSTKGIVARIRLSSYKITMIESHIPAKFGAGSGLARSVRSSLEEAGWLARRFRYDYIDYV